MLCVLMVVSYVFGKEGVKKVIEIRGESTLNGVKCTMKYGDNEK